jgi:hypothetical protein
MTMDAGAILDALVAAVRAVDNLMIVGALVLLASIFAAVGGLVSWRARLYGAMIGGMVANAVAKAEGASYASALVAMLAVTLVAVALGSAGLVVRLMKASKRP